ncbi:DUF3810 domain-containing protein [Flavobacterium sp.]|uniref:DUF3810 domain-containing protein n=1 Tax=Flavobacterium sp. TaxID=239 RepID=UPI003C498573
MKTKYILPLFLIIQILFLKVIAFFPEFIEYYYSNGLYLFSSKILRISLGIFPFSIGDLLYGILIFFILKWFWNKRKSWKTNWKNNSLTILSYLSVVYFSFHLLWGLNYYREPLFEKMNIQKDYSDAQLLDFTQKLILKTNAIHSQITPNDSLKVVFPYTQDTVYKMNVISYHNLAQKHTFFEFKHLSSKPSIISLPLTYMGFGGYLNPFTNESQVNYKIPMVHFPFVSAHEMAHQLGYGSESECNFIGFLASVKNENLYFKYAGYSYALRYCLGNWQMRDEKVFKKLLKTIHPGIIKNYQESDAFWKSYQSPIETAFHVFYDRFLKINQQQDGIDSYSKFLNLLINYKEEI